MQLISIMQFCMVIIIFSCPMVARGAGKGGDKWQKLTDGISYSKSSYSNVSGVETIFHAFLVDPKKNKFDVVMATDEVSGTTAEGMAKKSGALIAINGGFFTPDHKSIGLIIKGGNKINPIHKTSWWSIFTMSNDTPRIYTPREYERAKDLKTAIQAGPRLVVDGTIPKLKEGVALRSGVGITADGRVVIAITQGAGVSLAEFARKMASPVSDNGFGCKNAMALDGGGSSQLYAKIKKFNLALSGIARVTNGLAVFAK